MTCLPQTAFDRSGKLSPDIRSLGAGAHRADLAILENPDVDIGIGATIVVVTHQPDAVITHRFDLGGDRLEISHRTNLLHGLGHHEHRVIEGQPPISVRRGVLVGESLVTLNPFCDLRIVAMLKVPRQDLPDEAVDLLCVFYTRRARTAAIEKLFGQTTKLRALAHDG